MFKDPFYKQAAKMFWLILGVMVAAKFGGMAVGFAIVVVGVWSSLTRKPAWALMCFAMMPLMVVMNPMIFGIRGMSMPARLGIPCMTMAMVISASSRPGRQMLPLGAMFFYIVAAAISSINGYAPLISYLKLFSYSFFVMGIYMGTKNIDRRPQDLVNLRAFLFAFATLIILGSFALNYLRPAAAHYSAHGWEIAHAGYAEYERNAELTLQVGGDLGFFCGITNHSQCMGPLGVCLMGWVLCDMLFLEKRVKGGHMLLVAICPILIYWTKSRTALLAMMVLLFSIFVYCIPQYKISPALKRRIRSVFMGFLAMMFVAAVVMECTSHSISSWMMKYDTTGRGREGEVTMQGLASTRMGLIAQSMYDFERNPLFGSGFQVSYQMQSLAEKGELVLSAPIEKGFMPAMVLGETGVFGAIAFIVFLIAFYSGCRARKYFVTGTLFGVFLATNLGEATFFAPGGIAGPVWVIMLIGGFVIDISCQHNRRAEQMMGGYPPPMMYGYPPPAWR